MRIQQLPNADASVITVTTTAALLEDLIDTAAGEESNLPNSLNGVNLVVEDGTVRALSDGNTPTATKGMLLESGRYIFRGLNVKELRLIGVGGNATVGVEVGYSQEGEQDMLPGGSSITYPFTFDGDVTFDGDATFNANTNVGAVTGSSLAIDGPITEKVLVLANNTDTIDWGLAQIFKVEIDDDIEFSFTNVTEGRTIALIVDSDGDNDVDFDEPIEWVGEVVPIQGEDARVEYVFTRVDGDILGRANQNYG